MDVLKTTMCTNFTFSFLFVCFAYIQTTRISVTCILLPSIVSEVRAVQTQASYGEEVRAVASLEAVGTTAGWDKVDTSGEFSWGASVKTQHHSNTQRSE